MQWMALSPEGRPLRVKMSPVPGFTLKAVADWARSNLRPGTNVLSDGLSCFGGVIDAGCAHSYIVVGDRKPRDMPQFLWVNTVLGNLKTAISGAYKSFRYRKYATRYLGAFSYRFNRRFNLRSLVAKVFGDALRSPPEPERVIRGIAELRT